MKYKIFAVYDSKAAAYMSPFFMGTTEQAQRSFIDAINNPELPFQKHPQDYTIFELGEFNDHTGHVEGITPTSLGNALELITQGKEP